MQDLDLDLLRCFVTVADTRSFTTAGARLGRSQSAVSIRIRKLEERLGDRLLNRSNQHVALTPQGKALLPRARTLLEDSERLLAEMRAPTVTGRLRIGFLEYLAPQHIPSLLAAIQRRLPDADVSFHVGLSQTLKAALNAGALDLALALQEPAAPSTEIIVSDPLVWAESALSPRTEERPTLPLCLMASPCIYRTAALDALQQIGRAHREVLTCSSISSVRSAVASGLGVSVIGQSGLGGDLRVCEPLQAMSALPSAILSLQGQDPRKPDVAELLRSVLMAQMSLAPQT